jgi:branched-chain amino acid transport system substrate-binding protein
VPSLALSRVRPLRIGVIGSWSGPYAGGGRQFDAGMAVWLAAHNQHIGGRPVELLRRDVPGSAPEQARRHAQELVDSERVDLLAGLDFSSNAYAVGAVATQARIPLVVMNAASSRTPANRRFTAAFEAEYGSHLRPAYFAVAAHDAMAAIDAAIGSAGLRGNVGTGVTGGGEGEA